MKQHITVEQLYEFIENEHKGFIDERADAITDLVGKHYGIADIVEKMTIGKMIEILDEKYGGMEYYYIGTDDTEICVLKLENALRDYKATELCDCLWEAVKGILVVKGRV